MSSTDALGRTGVAPRRRKRALHVERLEPRVLLSADFVAGAFDGGDLHGTAIDPDRFADHDANVQLLSSVTQPPLAEPLAVSGPVPGTGDVPAGQPGAVDLDELSALLASADDAWAMAPPTTIPGAAPARLELVVVDAGVADADALIDGLAAKAGGTVHEVLYLDGSRGGAEQVAAVLAALGRVDAVHLLGHGGDAGFQFGADWIDAEALAASATAFESWRGFLADDADLLLYGCDLAAGPDGAALLERLADLTGADVAASDDRTGGLALGGDWDLEVRTGVIEADMPFGASALAWSQVLAGPFVASPIRDVEVERNAPDTTIPLRPVFRDPDTPRPSLVYTIDSVSNPDLFTSVTIDGPARQLHLDYAPSAVGTAEIVVRASDGTSSVTDTFTVTVTEVPILRFSTAGDVSSPAGATGSLAAWQDQQLIEFRNPSLAFAPSTTDGTFRVSDGAFDIGLFPSGGVDLNVDAMHVVSRGVTIGTSNTVDVEAGDLLLSLAQAATLTSTDASTLDVTPDDVFIFRPDLADDYSAGTFIRLLDDVNGDGSDVTAISLVESDTALTASRTLQEGEFLYGIGTNEIHLLTAQDLDAADIGTQITLVDGTPLLLGPTVGIELIERDLTIGNVDLHAGDLLLAAGSSSVVFGAIAAAPGDIYIADFTTTTFDDLVASGTARAFFDGSDVGLVAAGDAVDAISLENPRNSNLAPTATNLSALVTYTEGDAAVALPDIVVTDADTDPLAVITATLTLQDVTAGVLSTSGTATHDAATGVWTITGSVADVNAALAAVAFLPATDNDVDTTIVTHVEDEFSDGPDDGVFTLDVTPVDDAPTTMDVTVTTAEDRAYAFTAADFAFMDVDTGDALAAVRIAALETAGALRLDGVDVTLGQVVTRAALDAGRLTFTPAADANGAAHDAFAFTVSDGTAESAGAILTIDVTAVNDAPTAAVLAAVEVEEDAGPSAIATGFADVDGDSLSFVIVSVTGDDLFASLSVDAAGLVSLTYRADASGAAALVLRATDPAGSAVDTTLDVRVSAVNDAPVGTADEFTVGEDGVLRVTAAAGLLGNDLDVDAGDTLSIVRLVEGGVTGSIGVAFGGSAGGAFTVTADGALVFDPGPALQALAVGEQVRTGVDYVIRDAAGALATARVTVTVNGANDAVLAATDAAATTSDAPLEVAADAGVLRNDSDPDGSDLLRVVGVASGAVSVGAGEAIVGDNGGTFTVLADGSYRFDPAGMTQLDAGEAATTTVVYSVGDGNGSVATAALSVTVRGVDAVVAVAEALAPQATVEAITATGAGTPVTPATPSAGSVDSQNASADEKAAPGPAAAPESGAGEGPAPTAGDGTAKDAADAPPVTDLALATLDDDFGDAFASFGATGVALLGADTGAALLAGVVGADVDVAEPQANFQLVDLRSGGLDEALRDGLIELSDPLVLVATTTYRNSLDEARLETAEQEEREVRIVIGSMTLTTGLSIGYVLWLLRSGVIMSSMLSALPAWRLIDPLPILSSLRSLEDDGESIEDIVRSSADEQAGAGEASEVVGAGRVDEAVQGHPPPEATR
ncbi:MAG TPA: DUF4347 domain-containing protein [Pseudomonadales bacterium]|nr:DUF4347 domain-containing protein [Pseudomonadales bacterium]